MSKKILYTALMGNYDSIHKVHMPNDWDCIMFTDLSSDRLPQNTGWKFIHIDTINQDLDNYSFAMKNRWFKFHPHILFPEDDISLYIDSNLSIADYSSLEHRLDQLISSRTPLSIPVHPSNTCVYKEILSVLEAKKQDVDRAYDSLVFLISDHYPINNGLYENNIIFRFHNHPLVISSNELVWECLNKYASRDQFFMVYSCWKFGLPIVAFFEDNVHVKYRNDIVWNKHFVRYSKKTKFKRIGIRLLKMSKLHNTYQKIKKLFL